MLLLLVLSLLLSLSRASPADSIGRAAAVSVALAELMQSRSNLAAVKHTLSPDGGRVTYAASDADHAADAAQLAADIKSLLDTKEGAVKRIATAAAAAFAAYTQTPDKAEIESCSFATDYAPLPAAEVDPASSQLFYANVTTKYSTVRFAHYGCSASDDPTCRAAARQANVTTCVLKRRLDDVYQENMRTDALVKWQYVGTHDGTFMQFPGAERGRDASTDQYAAYDPRVRPWYVASAGGPRDVVLVLDTSGSMEQHNRMQLMRDAANAVLDTLSQDDFVQVVTFSGEARTSRCLPQHLVRATAPHVDALRAFVADATALGTTNFTAALSTAYDLLEASRAADSSSGCGSAAFLLLTDGEPTKGYDGISLARQKTASSDTSAAARVFMFALGGEATLDSTLACLTDGAFVRIPDGGNLRSAMASYYELYAQGGVGNNATVTTWTRPYIDASGLGLMITVSTPVYVSVPPDSGGSIFSVGGDAIAQRMLGVAGVDVVLGEFEALIDTYVDQHSYAFLVDRYGRAIFHPRLQRLEDDADAAPVFQHINALEESVKDGDFERLVGARIAEGGDGSADVQVRRLVPRGERALEGYDSVLVNATYHWHVAGPFTVCLVVDAERRTPPIAAVATGDDATDFYHAAVPVAPYRDLAMAAFNRSDAVHRTQIITRATSVVKFQARAFDDGASYLAFQPESQDQIVRIQEAINIDDAAAAAQAAAVREAAMLDAHATRPFSGLWSSGPDASGKDGLLWVYRGSPLSFRIFPGYYETTAGYDPTVRPWYRRALSRPGALAVSSPYNDAFGSGIVVTLSQTVRGGVVGVDFGQQTFAERAVAAANCTVDASSTTADRPFCFVFDANGYLVVYPFGSESTAENVFIAQREPDLARLLLQRGVLEQRTFDDITGKCTVFVVNPLHAEFRTRGAFSGRIAGGCNTATSFDVVPVVDIASDTETNLYLAVLSGYRQVFRCVAATDLAAGCVEEVDVGPCEAVDGSDDGDDEPWRRAPCLSFSLTGEELENFRERETGSSCATVNSVSTEAIVAYVLIGVVVVLCLCACGAYAFVRHRRRNTADAAAATTPDKPLAPLSQSGGRRSGPPSYSSAGSRHTSFGGPVPMRQRKTSERSTVAGDRRRRRQPKQPQGFQPPPPSAPPAYSQPPPPYNPVGSQYSAYTASTSSMSMT